MEIAEVAEKFTSDPAFREEFLKVTEQPILQALQQKGLVVRTPEEEQTFLSNYEQNVLEPKIQLGYKERIGEEVKNIYNRIDEDIYNATGQRKRPDQKTYDHLKEVLSIRLDETSKVLKSQIESLSEKASTLEQQLIQEKEQFSKKMTEYKVNSTFDSEFAKRTIAVPSTISDEGHKKAYIEQQINAMKSNIFQKYQYADTQNGMVFLKQDGTPVLNPKTATPATAEDLLTLEFGYYFVDTSKQGGLGSGGKNEKGEPLNSNDVELSQIKAMTDKDEQRLRFAKFMAKNNMIVGSKEHSAAYKAVFY